MKVSLQSDERDGHKFKFLVFKCILDTHSEHRSSILLSGLVDRVYYTTQNNLSCRILYLARLWVFYQQTKIWNFKSHNYFVYFLLLYYFLLSGCLPVLLVPKSSLFFINIFFISCLILGKISTRF